MADELAARADIGRSTLRDIETGRGTTQFAAVMSVITALGIDRPVVEAADPLNHDLGRMRAHLMHRERVR
ncbi:transcriptional regulator [Brevibacterium salitolerans]|uniref:HTH cro/C1-type domain-containing protein n=1 Tax=Brevibacterium salitolerans TaxID=1403566 RepID=A0ABP5IX03_9MICO